MDHRLRYAFFRYLKRANRIGRFKHYYTSRQRVFSRNVEFIFVVSGDERIRLCVFFTLLTLVTLVQDNSVGIYNFKLPNNVALCSVSI